MIPAVTDSLSSLASCASSGFSSIKSAVVSLVTTCYNQAMSALSSVKDAGKRAYTFTASAYADNKKVADCALMTLGAIGLGAAAYAGRAHIMAAGAAVSKLWTKN